jgi:hypothetical protein
MATDVVTTGAPVEAHPDTATHPEEMRASYELRLGERVSLRATARITPAGVICVGLAAAAITLAACFGAALIRRAGR